MSNAENFNKVTQSNNEVANGDIIGRDKNTLNQNGLIVNILSSKNDLEGLIDFLTADSGRTKDFIRNFLTQNESGFHKIQSIDKSLFLLEALKSSSFHVSGEEIATEYDKIVQGKNMTSEYDKIKYKYFDAATCVNNLEFDTAHQILETALEKIDPGNDLYHAVYKEYLITGFICYTRRNDINGLKSLLGKKSEVGNATNSDIDYIVSMVFQEIFSRDIDINSLHNVVSKFDNIFNNVNEVVKPAMAISLGLAYRRLGERTNIAYLEKAISIFKKGLDLEKGNKKINVELKDQMAIAHIRIFEFNKDEKQLNIAEGLLKDCLILLEGPMDPRDSRLKPRVLNNLGNIYKQRALIFKDIISATKAISCYDEAEKSWNKKDAKYDWALLRKNLAETKYALGKITNDTKMLLEALSDSIQSIKYRNLKNSPYQWGKTVKVIFLIAILLDELNSIKLISKSTRSLILSYINTVLSDDTKWSENISTEFIQNANQVQTLLL